MDPAVPQAQEDPVQKLRELIHDQPFKSTEETEITRLQWEDKYGFLRPIDPKNPLCGIIHNASHPDQGQCNWSLGQIYGHTDETGDDFWICTLGLSGWGDKQCHRAPAVHINPPTVRYCTFTCHASSQLCPGNTLDRRCGCEYRRGEGGRGGANRAICVKCVKKNFREGKRGEDALVYIPLAPKNKDPRSVVYNDPRICPECNVVKVDYENIKHGNVLLASTFLQKDFKDAIKAGTQGQAKHYPGRFLCLECGRVTKAEANFCRHKGCPSTSEGKERDEIGFDILYHNHYEKQEDWRFVNTFRGDGNPSNSTYAGLVTLNWHHVFQSAYGS